MASWSNLTDLQSPSPCVPYVMGQLRVIQSFPACIYMIYKSFSSTATGLFLDRHLHNTFTLIEKQETSCS